MRTSPAWPFTARELELARVCAALDDGRTVVLSGDRGTGRSRLLAAALERMRRPVVRLASFGAADLDRLPARAVVGIDDAEQLAPDAADAVGRLADAGRITVLAVVRDGVWLPEWIGRLRLHGLAVPVRPFRSRQLAAVLSARLGGAVDESASRGMAMLTGGNAVLLRELTEHALAEGSLRRTAGRWELSGLTCVDGRLADVVRTRLGPLSAAEAELVDVVALAGLLHLDEVPELATAAESLTRRGVLTEGGQGGRLHLRLTHPLCGEVVVAAMPELTARRVRARLATPPAPVAEHPELTDRERQIAGYAAAGLSNRAIADVLVVSVRTVENHLQRVYGKLGITRRAALRAALACAAPDAAAPPRRRAGSGS